MTEQKEHDSRISIIKAICIILMVVGHSGCPAELHAAIYLFHMPCFFFVSGFFFKDKYLDTPLTFVKRRFKGLWWPFVKFSLLFLALHNLFAAVYLYDSTYTWQFMAYKVLRICTLTGSEQLLGGFWFLKELLFASLFALGSMLFLRKIVRMNNCNLLKFDVLLTIVFLLAAYVLSVIPFKIPLIGSVTMLSTSFYLAGYCFSKCSFSKLNSWLAGVCCLATIAGISFCFQGSMYSRSTDIFVYFVVALLGTYGIVNISGKIGGFMHKILDSVGEKTLYILTFHFLSFKLVSLIKVLHYDLPWERLSSFPVIEEYNSVYWMVYSLVGVVVPILIWECVKFISRFISTHTCKTDYGNNQA